jgi:hypothetical protein
MKLVRSLAMCTALACSLALAGCSSGAPEEGDEITSDDVVDLGDLITQDPDAAAAAAQIGDPATLLAEGRREAGIARGDVGAVFDFLRKAAEGEPTRRGVNPRPNAVWERNVGGTDVRLTVVRVLRERVRYLLEAKKSDGTYLPLLTGIFIRGRERAGGGRFHVDLSAVSDIYGAPNADGSLHFMFANLRGDKRGRRIAYRDVTRRDDASIPAANFSADLVRIVGEGGRFRSVGVADALPEVPGNELFALRLRWRAGLGGRGDAIFSSLADPQNPTVLGKAHECWDKDGLRTAYTDDYAANDAENPNEGDTATCHELAQEDVPVDVARPDGEDADPELDALLDEAGALGLTEADAEVIERAQ